MTNTTASHTNGGGSRSLHLVDLENLLGDHRKDEIALEGLRRYLALASWSKGDQVLVAAHPEIIRQVGFEPPAPCSLHACCGDDAADVMLLSLAPPELVARRYDRLVVGSGDGIFIRRARAARDRGVGVVVVARSDGVADGFRRWGFRFVPFDWRLLPSGDGIDLAA